MLGVDYYLEQMFQNQASDLYLTVGVPPALRKDSEMISLGQDALTTETMNDILKDLLNDKQIEIFHRRMEFNISKDLGEKGRYRINCLLQKQTPAMVVRRIESDIPEFEKLGLPQLMEGLSLEKRGLVLVTGVTASGKSTTLASMIDYKNRHDKGHIVTLEDPIEYFHDHKGCIVTQREVGIDTESYSIALKNVLRQRPDLILIGEIRDQMVMEQAITIAETGHLAMATLHTLNAYQTIERIMGFFHENRHEQVRLSLALNLRAVICQRLVPAKDGGMRLALEIMLNEGLIRELLIKGDISRIRKVIEENQVVGMCSFDQSLMKLYTDGEITAEVALMYADRPGDMKVKMKTAFGEDGLAALGNVDTNNLRFTE